MESSQKCFEKQCQKLWPPPLLQILAGGLHCLFSLYLQFTPVLMDNDIPVCAAFQERMRLSVCSSCSRVQSCWDERHWVKAGSLSASCCWEVLLLIRSGNLAQSNIYCQRVMTTLSTLCTINSFNGSGIQQNSSVSLFWAFWVAKGAERVLSDWSANQVWCK